MSTPEFYANARAYDIAFGDRDYADECRFLEWCWRTHGRTAERSFLELACGPGRHAQQFARLGWRSAGLDLSEDMLIYADEVARLAGARVDWRIGNMVDYTLPEPVALVGCLMESLTHLVTNEEVVTHFRAVARSLVAGGVYVIEMAHPDSIWRDSLPNFWTRREGDMEVEILFGHEDDPYDWITQQWLVTTRLNIRQDGQPERILEHHHPHRWYLAQELRALIDLSGAFSQTWFYGDMMTPPPAIASDAERMVLVLRK
jgi:SAM-dependent methyltransferase